MVRKDAERLFALAEERKQAAKAARTTSEALSAAVETARAKIESSRGQAAERFAGMSGADFLYFRHQGDSRHAFAVALAEDKENYNVEVKPLAIYSVEQHRGVGFLEPARASSPSLEEGDKRFEEYFLKGRKGEIRTSSGPPSKGN
jgi:hypothetical protein